MWRTRQPRVTTGVPRNKLDSLEKAWIQSPEVSFNRTFAVLLTPEPNVSDPVAHDEKWVQTDPVTIIIGDSPFLLPPSLNMCYSSAVRVSPGVARCRCHWLDTNYSHSPWYVIVFFSWFLQIVQLFQFSIVEWETILWVCFVWGLVKAGGFWNCWIDSNFTGMTVQPRSIHGTRKDARGGVHWLHGHVYSWIPLRNWGFPKLFSKPHSCLSCVNLLAEIKNHFSYSKEFCQNLFFELSLSFLYCPFLHN